MANFHQVLLFVLTELILQTNCLVKRYGAGIENTDLAIAYNGSLTSSFTCQGHNINLGFYSDAYIIASAPLTTAYGDTWEKNIVHFGFFHGSSGGFFLTDDSIYGLQFATAAWVTDETDLYDTSQPGERILDLSAASVELRQAMVGEEQGYIISGDQRSVDVSARQPNSVGIYLPTSDTCGSGNIIFNWTQSRPFNYSIGFSNATAWFSLESDVGNGTTVSISLNATRVFDEAIVRYNNTVLDTSNSETPVFINPTASSSASASPATKSSSAASAVLVNVRVKGICWGSVMTMTCGFAVGLAVVLV